MEREVVYVSPEGLDSAEGLHDAPCGTLTGARDAARVRRLDRPDRAVDIVLLGGVYRCDKALELTATDGGHGETPTRLRAAPGEEVVVTGSRMLRFGDSALPPEVAERLTPEQRRHIRSISFEEAGIPPITEIQQRGRPPLELYCNGERLPISRYPSDGWLRIEDVPQDEGTPIREGLDRERRFKDVPVGRHYGRFVYPESRPEAWGFHREILLHGYWTWDWNDSYQTIESIDTDERTIHLAPPHHHYGYTTNQRFAFLNVLEEIDGPGKWCFHRETGRIYLWPVDDPDAEYEAAVLQEPLVRIANTSHIEVMGITFARSLGAAVEIRNGADVRIAGCTCTKLGETAVQCLGSDNTIESCDLFDLAAGGIKLVGGDRNTLRSGHNRAENNHIHHFSRWVRTYQHAVAVEGVGNVVSHNLMHDAPQEAMYFRGNEHLIEYNEIHTVTTETGDSGAIHTGRDWTWRGTVLRFNLIHNLPGAGLHGSMGIYLDDFMSATTIYGNIFHRAGRAAFIGGGRDNTVKNNLFIACKASVHVDARGTSWAAYYFDGTYPVLFDGMDAMDFRNPPYSERYPELLDYYDDDPAVPKHNRIVANVSCEGRWLELRDTVRVGDLVHERNYVADEVVCEQLREDLSEDPYFLDIDRSDPYEIIRADDTERAAELRAGGNVVEANGDPVPGWRKRDFSVRAEVADLIDFEQIPFDRIGLRLDEYRTGLPDPAPLE